MKAKPIQPPEQPETGTVLEYSSPIRPLPKIIGILAAISILIGVVQLSGIRPTLVGDAQLVARSSATVGMVPIPKAKSFTPADVLQVMWRLRTITDLTEAQETQLSGLVKVCGPNLFPGITSPVAQSDLDQQKISADKSAAAGTATLLFAAGNVVVTAQKATFTAPTGHIYSYSQTAAGSNSSFLWNAAGATPRLWPALLLLGMDLGRALHAALLVACGVMAWKSAHHGRRLYLWYALLGIALTFGGLAWGWAWYAVWGQTPPASAGYTINGRSLPVLTTDLGMGIGIYGGIAIACCLPVVQRVCGQAW